jgi:hypothetical protein
MYLLCICNRSPQSSIKIRFRYLYSDRQTILSRFDGFNFDFGQQKVNKLQFISLCLSEFLLCYFYSAKFGNGLN